MIYRLQNKHATSCLLFGKSFKAKNFFITYHKKIVDLGIKNFNRLITKEKSKKSSNILGKYKHLSIYNNIARCNSVILLRLYCVKNIVFVSYISMQETTRCIN